MMKKLILAAVLLLLGCDRRMDNEILKSRNGNCYHARASLGKYMLTKVPCSFDEVEK